MVYIRPHYFHPKTRNLKRVVFHTDRQVFRLWKIYVAYIRLHYFHPKKLENLRESFFFKHMFYGGSNSASTVQPLVRSTPETLFSALQYTSIHHKASTIYCLALQRSKQFQINNAKKGFFSSKTMKYY